MKPDIVYIIDFLNFNFQVPYGLFCILQDINVGFYQESLKECHHLHKDNCMLYMYTSGWTPNGWLDLVRSITPDQVSFKS